MHFGGLHLFAGILFLACCMGFTSFYVYAAYVICVACRKMYVETKRRFYDFRNYLGTIGGIFSSVDEDGYQSGSVNPSRSFVVLVYAFMGGQGHPKAVEDPPPLFFRNKSFFKQSSLLIIFLLSIVYGLQRTEWMGNENAHYKAKEYYVAGQVVFLHRKMMALALHPENILIRPYTALQEAIYSRGVRYLPEEDGERFVWKNQWFLYLYSRKLERPQDVGDNTAEPQMVQLLDHYWETMEGMETHGIADPEMKKSYALGFPVLATYYSLYQGHYTGALMNSGKILRKTDFLIDRNYRILHWLDQLEGSWKQSGLLLEIVKTYPNIAAIHQGTTLDVLQDLSLTIVLKGEFSCDHSMIERLHQEYINAMSDDPSKNYFLLYSKKNMRQAKVLYQSSVYGARGGAANYLLSHICGKKMPNEKFNISSPKDGLLTKFYSKKRVEFVFREELKPLLMSSEKRG